MPNAPKDRYSCPETGAHFEYFDMCARLERMRKRRNIEMQRTEKKVLNKEFMNGMKQHAEGDLQRKEFKTEKVRQEIEESEYQLEKVEEHQKGFAKTAKSTKGIAEEPAAHHYRVQSNELVQKKTGDQNSNNLADTGELAQHAKTEDRRKEGDITGPELKIRKVAVMDPKRQNSEVQQLARRVELKAENADTKAQ